MNEEQRQEQQQVLRLRRAPPDFMATRAQSSGQIGSVCLSHGREGGANVMVIFGNYIVDYLAPTP